VSKRVIWAFFLASSWWCCGGQLFWWCGLEAIGAGGVGLRGPACRVRGSVWEQCMVCGGGQSSDVAPAAMSPVSVGDASVGSYFFLNKKTYL
jgi:hypothetical protein